MGEHDRSVYDGRVNHFEGAEVVFKAMADEDGVRVDESHHVVLNLAKRLGRTALEVARADAGEASVVVDDVALGENETLVDQSAFDANDRQFDEFETVGGEAHLAVDGVNAVVAVRRVDLSRLGANEAVERSVHSGLGKVTPDVDAALATASGGLRGWSAATREAVVFWPSVFPFLGSQLAPVVGAAFLGEILALRTDVEDL